MNYSRAWNCWSSIVDYDLQIQRKKSDNMKVLFTFFNPSGGMETLNRVRCAALTARGIECHMLYTHNGEDGEISVISPFI